MKLTAPVVAHFPSENSISVRDVPGPSQTTCSKEFGPLWCARYLGEHCPPSTSMATIAKARDPVARAVARRPRSSPFSMPRADRRPAYDGRSAADIFDALNSCLATAPMTAIIYPRKWPKGRLGQHLRHAQPCQNSPMQRIAIRRTRWQFPDCRPTRANSNLAARL